MTAVACYIRLGDKPLCDMLGCMAGSKACAERSVYQCSFPSLAMAQSAAKRLEGRFTVPLSVVRGDCPLADLK